MTYADWYLLSFMVGFALSVLSFLMGDFHLHLPHVGHGMHFHLGHGAAGDGVAHGGHAHGAGELPVINFGTVAAFLAWFGGVGFLLTRHSGLLVLPIVLLSTLAGFVGASIVFLFVAKVLLRHEHVFDPTEEDPVGALGRVTSSIRQGGTGEMVFSQRGARHTSGARSETGAAVERGTEVVITRYEKGIAYVRPWEEMSNEPSTGMEKQAQ